MFPGRDQLRGYANILPADWDNRTMLLGPRTDLAICHVRDIRIKDADGARTRPEVAGNARA